MKSSLPALALVLFAVAGCASTETPANTEQASTTERVYRPGSNLIVKDRKPLTQEEKDQQAEEARKLLSIGQRPIVK